MRRPAAILILKAKTIVLLAQSEQTKRYPPRRTTGAAMLSTMILMQAGLPLARARSIAPGSSARVLDKFAMAAQRRHHLVVAAGSSSQPCMRFAP